MINKFFKIVYHVETIYNDFSPGSDDILLYDTILHVICFCNLSINVCAIFVLLKYFYLTYHIFILPLLKLSLRRSIVPCLHPCVCIPSKSKF